MSATKDLLGEAEARLASEECTHDFLYPTDNPDVFMCAYCEKRRTIINKPIKPDEPDNRETEKGRGL